MSDKRAQGRENRRKESKRWGCSCERCRQFCRREPGWFLPNEIRSAANIFGLSEDEFIKQYCEEHQEDGVLVISPARKPGQRSCIFLTRDGLCQIHDAKPHECRKVFECQGEFRHLRIREIIKKSWAK